MKSTYKTSRGLLEAFLILLGITSKAEIHATGCVFWSNQNNIRNWLRVLNC